MGVQGDFEEEETSVVGEGAVEGDDNKVGRARSHIVVRPGKDSEFCSKLEDFKAG